MRIDVLITSTLLLSPEQLQKRQGAGQVPVACYSYCNAAGYDAQSVGRVYAALCADNAPFVSHLNECNSCIAPRATPPYTAVPPLLPSFLSYINYCSSQNASFKLSTYNRLAELTSLAAYCAGDEYANHTTRDVCKTDVTTINFEATTLMAGNSISGGASATQSPPGVTSSISPLPYSHTHTSAIVGGVVGGVGGFALFLAFAFFIMRHRRRRMKSTQPPESQEKAQLHSEDIKPDWKEAEGSKAPREFLERKSPLAEMPANEEVPGKPAAELTSKEAVGAEMETVENEMRVLDRLAGVSSTESKTLANSSERS